MSAQAQITHPKASPFSEVVQHIGLTEVRVSYSRPAVSGRKIMGELVPYGRIWRVGANESTKFTVDKEVIVLGNPLPKGTYALYAFPGETSWEVVFHTNTTHWGDGRKDYDPEEDLFRVRIVPEKLPGLQENFLITFDAIDHNSADMLWKWEYTQLRIPIEVDTRKQMMAEIESQIESNPTPQTYYEAARYYQEQGLEPEKALQLVNKALELGGDTYYFHRVKSILQASLGDYEAAIASAQMSLRLAQAQDKDEFVRLNLRNIGRWKAQINQNKQ